MAWYRCGGGGSLKDLGFSGRITTGSQPINSNTITVTGAKKITATGTFNTVPSGANEHIYLYVDNVKVATIHSGRTGSNTISYDITSEEHSVYVQLVKTSQTGGTSVASFVVNIK